MFTQVSWKKPLALAIILFTLGMTAYWLEFKRKPDNEAKEAQAKKLFSIKDAQIESLTVATGIKNFVLKCTDIGAKLCKPGDNSKWELVEPTQLRADDANVRSFLSTLDNISSVDVIDLKDEKPEKRVALLKDYGLDPAMLASNGARRVSVKIGADKNAVLSLYLGATHPIGDNLFALKTDLATGKIDETKVYLIASYLKANLDKDLTYWRDKKLFAVSAQEISSFNLKSSKGQISGEKKDGQWILKTKGEEYVGDIENIDSFLSSVAFLTAKEFVSENKADKKGKIFSRSGKPVVTLSFQTEKAGASEKQSAQTLVLIARTKPARLFATVSNLDPLYEVDGGTTAKFEKELKDLRLNKLITSMERFTAKKLEFSGAGYSSPLSLLNTEGKWLRGSDKMEMDSEKVSQFLEKLGGPRIKEFLTGKSYPTGEDQGIRIVVGDEKNDKKRQYLIWKKDNKLFAKDLQSNRKEAFGLDATIKDTMPWTPNVFDKVNPVASPAAPKASK